MAINTEQWKDIPGYEGRYQASTLGRIRSVNRVVFSRNRYTGAPFERRLKGQLLRPGAYSKTGHLSVVLGHKAHGSPVHQLVLKTFVGEPPPGTEVLHSNGDPTDNRLSNLRYGTRRENILDVYKQGKSWRKLSADDVQKIRKRLASGEGGSSIARDLGVSVSAVSNIKKGRTYSWLPPKS